jgi:ribosomal protein S27AE
MAAPSRRLRPARGLASRAAARRRGASFLSRFREPVAGGNGAVFTEIREADAGARRATRPSHPSCPVCGQASILHVHIARPYCAGVHIALASILRWRSYWCAARRPALGILHLVALQLTVRDGVGRHGQRAGTAAWYRSNIGVTDITIWREPVRPRGIDRI